MRTIDREQARIPFLDSVYSKYRNFMLSIVKSYIGDSQECEDVFHNAFVSLIRNREKLESLSPPQLKAYILLAVRHASIDYLRKARRMSLVDISDDLFLDLISKSRKIMAVSEMPFQTVEFYSVIRQLPVDDQTLLIGYYVVGLDAKELARFLGCSPEALRVRLHRANRKALKIFSALGLRLEDFLP